MMAARDCTVALDVRDNAEHRVRSHLLPRRARRRRRRGSPRGRALSRARNHRGPREPCRAAQRLRARRCRGPVVSPRVRARCADPFGRCSSKPPVTPDPPARRSSRSASPRLGRRRARPGRCRSRDRDARVPALAPAPPTRQIRELGQVTRHRQGSSPAARRRVARGRTRGASRAARTAAHRPTSTPADEVVVDERGERVEIGATDSSAASSVAPPGKTASRANTCSRRVVEEVDAPGDRLAQRLLARRQIARSAREEPEPLSSRSRSAPASACGFAPRRARSRAAGSRRGGRSRARPRRSPA